MTSERECIITFSNPTLGILEKFKQNRAALAIPTPLATYLYIYTHASYDSYINYMEGAKALAKYLAPIYIGNLVYDFVIPDMLASYELMELAKVLQPHTTAPHNINTIQIENAIYEHLTKSR